MKKILNSLLCMLSLIPVSAQTDYPFYADKGVTGWEMMKKDSAGIYVVVQADESKMVYFSASKKSYKLLDENYNVLEQGNFEQLPDKSYGRTGQWVSYYNNGRIKAAGRYYRNQPVGLWRKYYADGQPMSVVSFGIIELNGVGYYEPLGTYQEYYENGQLKTDGLYKAVFDTSISDALAIQDPKTGRVSVAESKGKIPHSMPAGTWYHYKENGELLRTEEH